VALAVFKTDVAEYLGQAGSIPVRLRQTSTGVDDKPVAQGYVLPPGPRTDGQLSARDPGSSNQSTTVIYAVWAVVTPKCSSPG